MNDEKLQKVLKDTTMKDVEELFPVEKPETTKELLSMAVIMYRKGFARGLSLGKRLPAGSQN